MIITRLIPLYLFFVGLISISPLIAAAQTTNGELHHVNTVDKTIFVGTDFDHGSCSSSSCLMKKKRLVQHVNPIIYDRGDLIMERSIPKMSNTQPRSISIQTGVSFSTIKGLNLGEEDEELAEAFGFDIGYITGFNIQASAYFPFHGKLGARLGLGWAQKGYSQSSDLTDFYNELTSLFSDDPDDLIESVTSTSSITSNYLSIPALLQFNPVPRVRILAGPVLSVFLGCSIKNTTEIDSETETVTVSCDEAEVDIINTLDISVTTGAGVDIPVSNRISISLDATFDLGLSNIVEDDLSSSTDGKYQGFRIVAGISIPLGS